MALLDKEVLQGMKIEKSWGYERILRNDYNYGMKLLVYTKPIASSLHYHDRKTESFYIVSGDFELELAGNTPIRAGAGQFFDIPAGMRHRVRCIEPGTIVEASTHDDPSDCHRLIPSEV